MGMITERPHLTARCGDVTLKQFSDVDLIQAVARQRDADAFGELFRRYQRRAFNLAYYICRNKEIAEEAVQEGMLRVWSGAETFKVQETDKVKSWILCIVARRAQLSGRRRRREQEIVNEQQSKESSSVPQPTDAIDRSELMDAMRKELDLLPHQDRVMVSLYFGAGMSQLQISKDLDISQTTVSFRVKKIIERLRGKLTNAGMATAGIALEPDIISDAVTQSLPAPTGMDACIKSIIKESPVNASNVSLVKSLPRWVAGGLACLAIAYTANHFSKGTGKNGIEANAGNASQTDHLKTTSTEASLEPLDALWNFEKEPMKGFPAIQGNWKTWRAASKASNGQASGMIAGSEPVCRALPISLPKRTIKITTTAIREVPRNTPMTPGGVGYAYLDEDGIQLKQELWICTQLQLSNKNRWNIETYIVGPYIIRVCNTTMFSIRKYKMDYPSTRIGIIGRGVGISQIEIQELPVSKFPRQLRTVDKLYSEILQSSYWAIKKTRKKPPETLEFSAQNKHKNIRPMDSKSEQATDVRESGLHKSWSIQDGPHEKLALFHGDLQTWRPSGGNWPATTFAGKGTAVMLPIALPENPFRIRISIDSAHLSKGAIKFLYHSKKSGAPAAFKVWGRNIRRQNDPGWRNATVDAYCFEKYIITSINGIPIYIQKYNKHSASFISLVTIQEGIQRIEITEMPRNAIPIPFRDPKLFLSGVLGNVSWFENKDTSK